MRINKLDVLGLYFGLKSVKKVLKKFGSYDKSCTFALPFEKRVAVEAESSLKD